MNNFNIEVDFSIPLFFGQVVYTVEPIDSQLFRKTCNICYGKGKIFFRDIPFTCPQCHDDLFTLPVVFSVPRYRLYHYQFVGIEKMILDNNNSSWPSNSEIFTITASFYRPKNLSIDKKDKEKYFECVGKTQNGVCKINLSADKKLYTDYEEALKVANTLNYFSRDKVKTYNEEHNTNFEFDFPKYDSK